MARPISVSNIAWDVADDEAIAALLAGRGVRLIDVAPGKYFPDPPAASDADVERVRRWWSDRGIAIHGMQALLFGTSGLNLFGTAEVQQRMLDRLDAVCRIAGGLGCRHLVFGSPKNRDVTGVAADRVDALAVSFFRRLGDIAERHGVTMCLEPNPPRYGCNFMTTTDEAARVVTLVDHPAVRMQLDTGTLTINGEDPALAIERHRRLIGHVHASEPDLVPLGEGGTDHRTIGALLARHLPNRIVAIEMVAAAGRPAVEVVGRSVDLMFANYVATAEEAAR